MQKTITILKIKKIKIKTSKMRICHTLAITIAISILRDCFTKSS
jgi:hypothetical protein